MTVFHRGPPRRTNSFTSDSELSIVSGLADKLQVKNIVNHLCIANFRAASYGLNESLFAEA